MIKVILLLGLLACLFYAFFQRNKSRLVAGGISALSLIGMIFVVRPDLASAVANMVGVGRGADLILYFWILFSVLVMMSLQFKMFSLQRTLTELAREQALISAQAPKGGENSQ